MCYSSKITSLGDITVVHALGQSSAHDAYKQVEGLGYHNYSSTLHFTKPASWALQQFRSTREKVSVEYE